MSTAATVVAIVSGWAAAFAWWLTCRSWRRAAEKWQAAHERDLTRALGVHWRERLAEREQMRI